MIQMVLVFCMIGDASVCVEQRPTYIQPMSMDSCLTDAEIAAVDYVRDHPRWYFARWRCEVNVPRRTPA